MKGIVRVSDEAGAVSGSEPPCGRLRSQCPCAFAWPRIAAPRPQVSGSFSDAPAVRSWPAATAQPPHRGLHASKPSRRHARVCSMASGASGCPRRPRSRAPRPPECAQTYGLQLAVRAGHPHAEHSISRWRSLAGSTEPRAAFADVMHLLPDKLARRGGWTFTLFRGLPSLGPAFFFRPWILLGLPA